MHRGHGRGPSPYTPASWPTTPQYHGVFWVVHPEVEKIIHGGDDSSSCDRPGAGLSPPLISTIAGNDHTNKPSDKAAMWTYLPVFFRPAIMTDMVWSSPPSFHLQRTNNDNDDIVSSYFQTHVGPSTICLGGSKTTVRQAHVAGRSWEGDRMSSPYLACDLVVDHHSCLLHLHRSRHKAPHASFATHPPFSER